MASALNNWEKDGLLDDAVVIIMSDHGHHWYSKFFFHSEKFIYIFIFLVIGYIINLYLNNTMLKNSICLFY